MISIETMLGSPLPWEIGVRMLPGSTAEVSQVALVESLSQVDSLDAGVLVVLTRATVESAGGYQFDVFVRQAVRRGAAAIVLRGSSPRSLTAEALARRGAVALLEVDDQVDPAVLVDELTTLVAGDARTSLRRLAATAAFDWEAAEGTPDEVVAGMAAGFGVLLEYQPGATTGGAEVRVDGRTAGVVRAHTPGDLAAVAERLAAQACAAVLARRERMVLSPVRTTSAALSQLLLCSQANLPAVAARAGEVGLDIGGWHCAARLTVEEPEAPGPTGLSGLEHELIGLVAEQLSPSDAASWSVARPDDSIVLVRTTRRSAGGEAPRVVHQRLDGLAQQLAESRPGLRIRVGVATAHEGAAGLRISAEEARTALAAARLAEGPVALARFDSLGTRRILAEWLTTDAAREAVRELLAPLDAQGPDKAATAIETLHAYLDEQGSLQRAGQRLHVHRNAVVYRLEKIRTLGYDLSDPDHRFALQLACRARLMTTGRLPGPEGHTS